MTIYSIIKPQGIKENVDLIGSYVDVKIDRPMGSKHPKHNFDYLVNYGFVPNTLSGDLEEVDVYVLGVDVPLDSYHGKVIAIIHRTYDNDDKLIVTNGREFTDEQIKELTHFQEQYFESTILRK